MKATEIRQKFLDFFAKKQHHITASAPMVLKDDPTLMFVNAGMVPFKEYFLGQKKATDTRVADSQKCLRVSGKQNDLEEVGKDTYHHTMFEMLGNWSFGDYFKKEAIAWAWELLTEEFGIDKESLYVTVFEGSTDSDNLAMDQEAYDLWKAIVPEDRILMGNKKDNFWEMGDQGPCGPCSEIHVDIRSKEEKAAVPGKDLVNMDHPQVVEIWNLVFMQYNRKADGVLENLPNKHVDTGMGFERLCMVMQDVQSNYDTDVFKPLIREIEAITRASYGNEETIDVAIRVIADHVRAVAFAIADGQFPSSNGAGYVIRRILRRAIRYGFSFLGTKEPFIFRLVEVLAKHMGAAFPEIKAQKNLVSNVIKEEEASFLRTLDQGLVLLDTIIAGAKDGKISGKKAFVLYDTYGFPFDLTALILEEKGLTVDEDEYKAERERVRNISKKAGEVSTDDWQVLLEDDEQEFIGYDSLEANVKLTQYRKVVSKKEGTLYQLVFNITPFYAEGGGQTGDKGYLEAANGDVTYIIDTKRENNQFVHIAKELPKDLSATFKAVVDEKQRYRSASNHSATHLLHQALRVVLGTHVEQKGSMVHSGYLRFDFSHFSKMTPEELQAVENFVNARITGKIPLEEKRNIPMQEAIDGGAMALFGEKYGDTVRTIRFGESIELCGGTHVANTADIWHFHIKSEGAVASGIRRIEAITGDAAKEFYLDTNKAFNAVKKVLKNTKNPEKAVQDLQEENSKLKKQIEQLLKEKAGGLKDTLKGAFQNINGVQFLAQEVDLDAKGIKDVCFELGGELDDVFIVLGAKNGEKALLSCYVSKSLVAAKDLNAGQVVRTLGKFIQGGGGGQAFFATAGGKNPAGIPEAIKEAISFVS